MHALKQISFLTLALFSVSSVAKTTTVCVLPWAFIGIGLTVIDWYRDPRGK